MNQTFFVLFFFAAASAFALASTISIASDSNELTIASDELIEYIATVQVSPRKQNGKAWDVAGGAPDIMFKVDNSYTDSRCRNQYRCEVKFISRKIEWYIEIYDKDSSHSDLIGHGKCRAGGSCKLHSAVIEIIPYSR